jgi:hypothetical protein
MPAHRNIAVVIALAAGAAALTTAAFASGPRLSDSQYIAAAHCQGLFNAHILGAADSSSINALMKVEGAYRAPDVLDRADEVRSQAMKQASHAGPGVRSELVSERDGVCQTWAKVADTQSVGR